MAPRLIVVIVVAALLAVAPTPASAVETTPSTPIMGPSQLTAAQIAGAFARTGNAPALPISVAELAALYVEEGTAEGVRGDLAFAQAVLETGWFRVWGDVPSSANNYAGIGATGGGNPGRRFATPRLGVRAHIQHLRFLADPTTTPERLANPPESRWQVIDRIGKAPTVEQLSGCTWACDPDYAAKVRSVYRTLGGQPGPAAGGAPSGAAVAVDTTSASAASAAPEAEPVDPRIAPRMPDGLVVRSDDERLWWLDAGTARPVRSETVLESWGVRAPRIATTMPGEVARRRPGAPLDWRPGTLLRLPDEPADVTAEQPAEPRYAVVDGDALRPVSAEVMAARGADPAAALRATAGEVAAITSGPPLEVDDVVAGEVIRSGDEVFEVATDGLLAVDGGLLLYARYGDGRLVAERPADAERPPVVGTVAFRDGTLLRGESGAVWLVSGGQRRYVPSRTLLDAWGVAPGAVLAVDDDAAERHDVGAPLEH